MSQYRVRANRVVTFFSQVDEEGLIESLLPPFIKQILATDLFAKYLPDYEPRCCNTAIDASTIPVASSSSSSEDLFFIASRHCNTVAPVSTEKKTVVKGHFIQYSTEEANAANVDAVSADVADTVDAANANAANAGATVVLSSLHYCCMTRQRFRGTYYAFLMSHTMPNKKKDTNIGVSRNPIFSVMAHNNQYYVNQQEEGDKGGIPHDKYYFPVIFDKDTASAAPNWRLHIVLGPFLTKRTAVECCYKWVKKTRGTRSKCDKAPKLADFYQCHLYSSQIRIKQPFDEYLRERLNAPPHYLESCGAIREEYSKTIAKHHQ